MDTRFIDFLQHRCGSICQMKAPDPAIRRVRTPLHKSARFKAVDESTDRDRFDLNQGREFVLRHARLTLETHEDHPLGAGHAVGPGERIGARPHQPSHIGKNTYEIAIKGLFHSTGEYKPRYDICKGVSGGLTVEIEKISPWPGLTQPVRLPAY
ncbi:MAG TPA: hypothetical protein VK479_02170 [Micropepsaceae bacterium]|nr:hypothetical protein [Micropepsaceae bacterium]